MMTPMRRLAPLLLAFASCAPSETTELESCHWIGTLNPLTGDLGVVGLPLYETLALLHGAGLR